MLSDKTIDKYKSFVGKDFGCIHIDEMDLSDADKNRLYFKCTCMSCGRKLRMRNDAFVADRKHVGCSKCMGKWRKNHFKELYKDKQPKIYRVKCTHFRANAILRNIPFNLTVDDVAEICSKPCFYCGKPYCLGIDRIDNSKGYTVDNCVPCCGCCNKMKMDLELSFFLEQIVKIYNNLHNIKKFNDYLEREYIQNVCGWKRRSP